MSIPLVILLSDSEDEHYDPPMTIILSDSDDETPPHTPQYASEEAEDEDPEEEDSEDEDPEEEDSEDEDPELEPEHTDHPTPPTPIPAYDPYDIPPPFFTAHRPSDARRWTWIPDTLGRWGQQEGNPFPDDGASSSTAPVYPITGEPPHHTIPLLIARIERQENHIELLEDSVETLSGPAHVEELQQDVWTLEHHYQNLRDYTEQLTERVSAGPNQLREIERRLDGLEHSLEQFHALADTMRGYASYILKGDHIPN